MLSNYVIHDAQKKKLINEWEINIREVEKTQLCVSLVNHSKFKTIDHKYVTSLLKPQGLVVGTCGGIWTSMALTESAVSFSSIFLIDILS